MDAAVHGAASQPCEGTARANHRFAKTPGGFAVAKFQSIRNKTFGAEIFGHRTEDMLEKLADEDDPVAVTDRFNQFVHSFTAHFGFQFVLEVFFAEEIETISGDAAEDAVKQAGGKGPAGEICRGTEEAHRKRSGPAHPAFKKTLAVPIEEANASQRADFEQRAFHAPIRHARHTPGFTATLIGRRRLHFSDEQ